MLNAKDYRDCLSARTFAHLRDSCQALAVGQYLASAVWGAVLLEAILEDFAEAAKLPPPGQADLNGRIQQLQGLSRNRGPVEVPDEIVKRCHDIRNTRNRLVHDTGAAKSTLAQDAQFILAGLKVILDWFKNVPRERPEPSAASPASTRAGVRVFLSTINPHTPAQEDFLEALESRLRAIGVEPVRFVAPLYDKRDPIGRVKRAIESCRGVIVVGLERTHAYFIRDKEGTPDQREATHRQYTSGWLHLEAGIAHALGMEVFVVCQREIHSDGIFDRHWNSYAVAELDSLDATSPQLEEFLLHVRTWVNEQAASGEQRG